MELRHLRYFIAVAEAGSLTVAAEQRLHTSQPSLSRQIRDLEDAVGTSLLRRTARGVEPTPAGHAFLERARIVLSQVDAAVEAARRAAAPAKLRLALGFLTGEEMTWLPRVMQALREDLPRIDITVSSDYSTELAEAVARGRIDLAFMRAEPGFGLAYRTLAAEPLVALMPSDHPLAARPTVDARDLAAVPFIAMAPKARMLRASVDAYFERMGERITPRQEVDNPAMVMSLVASTRALSVVPAYVCNLLTASVVSRPLGGDAPTIDLVLGHDPANASPMVKQLMDALLNAGAH